jgi:16S rRNA (cytosine967-C5)-methyltransferase
MVPVLSTPTEGSFIRLRALPWMALAPWIGPVEAALAEVFSGNSAERALDRLLRHLRSLSAEERQAVAEAVFGVALWRRRLAWHLQLHWARAAPRALLFALLHELASVPAAEAARITGVDPTTPLREGPPPLLADACSLPSWLAELLVHELGEEAAAFANAINSPGPVYIRANTLWLTAAELAQRLAAEGVSSTPARIAPDGLMLHGRPNIYGLRSHQLGLFEVQDEGSQLLTPLLEAQPGEQILDFCAGAGGKTLAIAAKLRNHGKLHVHDVDPERLDRLALRCSRAGVDCVLVHRGDCPPELLVDRVLVDAPCSELGALRRGPDVRWRINPLTLPDLEALQRQVLLSAARHVRPGGRLVYATCTLRREENQDIAAWFERAHPDFLRVPPRVPWLPSSMVRDGFFLCLPHLHGTDAFFAAIFQRHDRVL